MVVAEVGKSAESRHPWRVGLNAELGVDAGAPNWGHDRVSTELLLYRIGKKRLSVMPRPVAKAFARRKVTSGSSMVVFMVAHISIFAVPVATRGRPFGGTKPTTDWSLVDDMRLENNRCCASEIEWRVVQSSNTAQPSSSKATVANAGRPSGRVAA